MLINGKDLMIGDWVINPVDNTPMKIEWDMLKIYNKFESIPITPDFLEKHGFKKQDYDGWLISENNGRRLIEYRTDYFDGMLRIRYAEEPFCDLSVKIKYIHELQHALRLVGIDKEITI